MKKYKIQWRSPIDRKWYVLEDHQYDTLEEARQAYEAMHMKQDLRIVEAYTVVRYKPVKEKNA